MNFTKRFNEALKLSKKRQVDIAREIGVSKQMITDWKKGLTFPSIQTFYLLCDALDVSADYLLGRTDI